MAIRYVGIEPEETKTPPKGPAQKPSAAVTADPGAPAPAEELPLGAAAAPAKPKRKRS